MSSYSPRVHVAWDGKLDFNIATVKPVYLATFAKKTGHGYRLCGKGYGEGLEPLLQVLNKLRAEVAQEDFVFGDYSNREGRRALRLLLSGLEPGESVAAGQELNYLEEYVTVLAELADGDAALTVCFVLFVNNLRQGRVVRE
ncbi:hypothetical protein IV203_004677 [Nitzschia inconspicua]|uniref:Uncharacterized protein n=1 Tax=Nitzschia inconspicua TaxID=303405 RepID=A0A9K3L5R6_9STRA|nr:hypothetical protein IV203_004677 [Nitzschia inconspicua]